MTMTKEAIRALLYKKQLRSAEIENLQIILPELMEDALDEQGQPILDANGQPTKKSTVFLRELTGGEVRTVAKNDDLSGALLIAFSLISKDTKEQVFSPTEAQGLLDVLGITVLQPLIEQAKTLSGLNDKEAAIKNG